ncbi:MAG: putative orfan [Satyrvirus sp.]|uniref:Putative orfan n=1 Tax=Satyrvirus sp. TaxID=2487771 RepID=A0A3G5AHK5_9VIRU|nr:MAG: putative orfan [Satyrvirus sp.]
MNYIPVFSPICGIITNCTNKSVEISGNIHNILSPISGTITEIVNLEKSIKISIINKYIDRPIYFFIKNMNVKFGEKIKQNTNIEYNEIIGEIDETSVQNLVEFFPNNEYIKIVDTGTYVDGGRTTIAYIYTNKLINIVSKTRQLIILTVPHFLCDESKGKHKCDYYAEKLALCIKKELSNEDRDIVLYNGNINRTITDLNRTESTRTNFRTAIRNRINIKINELIVHKKKYSSDVDMIFVLDCHSFPPKYFENIRYSNPDVSILFVNCMELVYIEELIETFKDFSVVATMHLGGENDIIREFYKLGTGTKKNGIRIIPVLIEVSEKITEEKLSAVCMAINKWTQTIVSYYKKN